LQPHIRTIGFASFNRFWTFFPYLIRPTASGVSQLAFWEFTMTTRGRFLLFTLAGAVALMIFLNDAAGASDCLAAPNRTPAGLSNESRNEPEVLASWHAGADGCVARAARVESGG
jgi:hypothetical protein